MTGCRSPPPSRIAADNRADWARLSESCRPGEAGDRIVRAREGRRATGRIEGFAWILRGLALAGRTIVGRAGWF